ncbi:hypothetical protein ACQKWADRAFT_286733 [Trichoderma austrokoningii]
MHQRGFGDDDELFEPTLSDVLVVRTMLARSIILPELVSVIMDYAEYWARSSAKAEVNAVITARRTGNGELDYNESQFLLRSYPVGLTERAFKDEIGGVSFMDGNFANYVPSPLPVSKEFDRAFFQQAIKNASSFSNPARKVVFRICSHDQGWTTDGIPVTEDGLPHMFISAKTWFDAGIERFDASKTVDELSEAENNDMKRWTAHKLGTIQPQVIETKNVDQGQDYEFPHTEWKGPYEIQRNRIAFDEFRGYKVTWTCWDEFAPDSPEALELMESEGKGKMVGNGQFVRNLKLGDVVTVWGRAMHRGWVNAVVSVRIDVYWAL